MDNDCDDAIDNPPLADAPPAGQTGCWNLPGNCCTFSQLNWCPPSGGTCNAAGTLTSPCAAGTLTCDEGAWTCANVVRPSAEVCDGIDNNCNGIGDEGTQAGMECTSGVGACEAEGVFVCGVSGTSCTAQPAEPSTELCDNDVDDDCNGMVDDGFALGETCTVGVGACEATGMNVCSSGSESCDATAGEPETELCGNGIDDDCNGFADEGFTLGETCTVGVGACVATGVTICDGVGTTCDATEGTPATGETCGNGIDDDCNEMVDDGCVVEDDAGVGDDAGVDIDASTPVTDAGADANTGGDDSSGCSCRAGATGSPLGARAIALGLIAVVLVRRRRARA